MIRYNPHQLVVSISHSLHLDASMDAKTDACNLIAV
jgi:hypothetical protein